MKKDTKEAPPTPPPASKAAPRQPVNRPMLHSHPATVIQSPSTQHRLAGRSRSSHLDSAPAGRPPSTHPPSPAALISRRAASSIKPTDPCSRADPRGPETPRLHSPSLPIAPLPLRATAVRSATYTPSTLDASVKAAAPDTDPPSATIINPRWQLIWQTGIVYMSPPPQTTHTPSSSAAARPPSAQPP